MKEKKSKVKCLEKKEIKLIILLSYYLTMYYFYVIILSIFFSNLSKFSKVLDYFACEAAGNNPDMPCPVPSDSLIAATNSAIVLVIVQNISFPLVNLMFVLDEKKINRQINNIIAFLKNCVCV